MNMKFNVDIKKFVILILALVVLFVPTYLAIASYYTTKKQPTTNDFTELVLKIPDGSVNTFTAENDTDGMLESFTALNKAGTAVDSLPDGYTGEAFLLGTFKRADGETLSYKYYFSDDADNCYYADPEGKFFKVAKSDALKFLDTKYALYLISSAALPVLSVSGGNTVTPTKIDWHYLVAGLFRTLDESQDSASDQIFDITNDLGLSFDIEPSSCSIKVYSGSELLFDGTPDTLSGLKIDRNDTLNFDVNAEWIKTDGCEYYGSAQYSFSAKVTAPAVFSLGESSIEQGTLVVLSGLNVTDTSKITFKSEPEIGCTPEFFVDGDYVRALIPIAIDRPATKYTFTVDYALSTTTLELEVTSKKIDKSYAYYELPKALVEANYSDSDIKEYKALVEEISSTSEDIKYFNGKFLNYEDNGIKIAVGYAKNMLMKYTDDFIHEGVDYMFALGAEAPALNSGKVVYVGSCDILGKFVVVDHGWGLKSWYAHLSEYSVSVGDTVTKGQTLGKVGSTGFIPTHRLHIGFTVNGIAVSPYPLQDDGLIYPNN